MADASERTEKPTPRRLEKAREEGRFVTSREALSAAVLAVEVWAILNLAPEWLAQSMAVWRRLFADAFRGELTVRLFFRIWLLLAEASFAPLLLVGGGLVAAALAAQMAITGFGISAKRLAPSWDRLNPWSRLREMPSQNAFLAFQGLAIVTVFGVLLAVRIPEWIRAVAPLPYLPLGASLGVLAGLIGDLLRESLLIFAVLGLVDFTRQRMKFFSELKMSRQEIRDEAKESEGNPQIKQRIRRLQRDAVRRRMMDKVPQATAVIVNPTHYSVAIEYRPEMMGAPKVVAKGRNYLARRIREIALAHQIPIIENPPLARSLYKHCEIGQEVPVEFYRAVAEVLAYIFQLMHRRAGAS